MPKFVFCLIFNSLWFNIFYLISNFFLIQIHYPFENVKAFEEGFPADFIAEGIDQTRGWFYTLLVLSTALMDKPPFKNLIVNGIVLAALVQSILL